MRRGTTPTLRITVGADITDMDIYLALRTGRKLLVKTNEALGIEVDGEGEDAKTVITAPLTQADTLGMQEGRACEVQVRAVKDDGTVAIATTIGKLDVERILQDGELR